MSFYDEHEHLVADVVRFLVDGVRANEALLVVATPAHLAAIDAGLLAEGISGDDRRAAGDYISLDAADTLAAFMVEGRPDRSRFVAAVGGIIERAGAGDLDERGVRVFGEMVALLWDDGAVAAAIELESLWNELAATHEFSLLCGYPLAALAGGGVAAATQVCDRHSAVLAPRSYGPTPSPAVEPAASSEVFLPVPSAVRAARRFVRAELHELGASAVVHDALLLASELASNAVRHAGSAFRLSVAQKGGVVRIAVDDAGTGEPVRGEPTDWALGGRGILLVDEVAASWGTDRHNDGKSVWCELALEAPARPAVLD
ncbi:MAG: MEDS domain-containing protein [Acidimicrobiia bacterium]|nr:MEDS domain-containing protein [Acidimicrobiia bacterium]